MKYKCSVCGYEYDEAKEGTLFKDLPDTWTCPVCDAPKGDFERIDSSGGGPGLPR
ncbi:rubredoxin [bacterium BMS3Abin01]|nr:rubredoxin [bacterium BMS3Abin01]